MKKKSDPELDPEPDPDTDPDPLEVRIRGSGSAPKCHGSQTLLSSALLENIKILQCIKIKQKIVHL